MRLYPGLSYMLKGISNNTCRMEGYDCFEIIYTELNEPQNRVLRVRSGALFRLPGIWKPL